MERIAWLVLGGVTFVAALRAGSSVRAMYIARVTLAVMFIIFGALVNAIYVVAQPDYYTGFADASPFPFVSETWSSLVLPHLGFFITMLIIFEATMGVVVLCGGRWTQIALTGLIAFHVAQLPFGGVLWPWAAVMITALVLLLRAERKTGSDPAAFPIKHAHHARA